MGRIGRATVPAWLWALGAVVLVVGIGAAWVVMAGRSRQSGRGQQGELEVYDVHLVTELGPQGEPGREVEELGPQAEELHLAYRYRGARPGEPLACEWYCGNESIADVGRQAELPAAEGWGRFDLSIRTRLPTGSWQVKLRARGAVVATVGFHVAAEPEPPLITNMVVCEQVDEREQAVRPRRQFPPRVAAIYMRFDYANAPLGERLTCQWRLGDELISKATTSQEISAPTGAGHFYLANPKREELPSGQYTVEILFGARVLGEAGFQVGAQAEGGAEHE